MGDDGGFAQQGPDFLRIALCSPPRPPGILESAPSRAIRPWPWRRGSGQDGVDHFASEVDSHHAEAGSGQHRRRVGSESHISVIEGPALRLARGAAGAIRPRLHRRRQGLTYDAYYEAVLPKLARSRSDRRLTTSLQGGGVLASEIQRSPTSRPRGAAGLQRQGRQRPPGRLRPDDHQRRRHAHPPGRRGRRGAGTGRRARLPPPPLAPLGAGRDALRLEQLAEYCARAEAPGCPSRRHRTPSGSRQADAPLGGFWEIDEPPAALAETHGRLLRSTPRPTSTPTWACPKPRRRGSRSSIGLEVDYYPGRMDDVAEAPGRLPLRRPAGFGALAREAGASTTSTTRVMAEWRCGTFDAVGRPTPRRSRSWRRGVVRRAGPSGPHKAAGHVPYARPSGGTASPRRPRPAGMAAEVARPAGASPPARVPGARASSSASSRGGRAADHGLGRPPARARGRPGRRPAGGARRGGTGVLQGYRNRAAYR